MKTRLYNSKQDYEYIYNALLSEGLSPEEMSFEKDNVIITDTGFFSYIKAPAYKYPELHHFYINPEQRNLKSFLGLVRELKNTVLSMGFPMFIAQQPKNKPHLGQFIRFAKGVKAFTGEGHTCYLVPATKAVGTRKRKRNENIQ